MAIRPGSLIAGLVLLRRLSSFKQSTIHLRAPLLHRNGNLIGKG